MQIENKRYTIILKNAMPTSQLQDMEVLKTSTRGEEYLLTLEALYIAERKPAINTKDEFKSRALTIKLF